VIPIYVPDTSALLKRYFDEAGSERMDELFEEASQGALEICLIPIVRYEIIARLKRVESAIRNRSAGRLPLLRTATSGHAQSIAQLRRAYNLLALSFERDMQACKPLESYFQGLPLQPHLLKHDDRVVEATRKHSIGVNDALILVSLSELVSSSTVIGKSISFMCADKQLRKATSTITALQIEPL